MPKKRKARAKPPTDRRKPELTGPASIRIASFLPWVLYALVTLWLFHSFVLSDLMLLGQDTLALGYVARAFFADAIKQLAIFPLWNPHILGGTPFLEALSGGDSLYPTSLLFLVMDTYRVLGWKLVIHIFLAGLFMWGWLRSLGLSRAASLIGGLAFSMAPFLVSLVRPGHDGKLFVCALTPLLFWVAERSLTGTRLRAFGGVGLVVALVLLTTHFQTAYFLFGAVGMYYALRCVQLSRSGHHSTALRKGVAFLLAAFLGAGAAAVQLVPAIDYVTEFSRRTQTTTEADEATKAAYSASWSLHPEELASYVVPEFPGNNGGGAPWATNTYWGRNPFKDNHEYTGLVVLLLAALSFFGAPRKGVRLFLGGLGAVALLYALGSHTPVWWAFFRFVPGVSLFRAPMQAAFLFGFAVVTLMAFGLERVLELASEGNQRDWRLPSALLKGLVTLLVILTLLAAAGVLTHGWISLLYSGISESKLDALRRAEPFLVRGFFLATGFGVALLGILWALQKGKLSLSTGVLLLGGLVALDLGRVDVAFIQTIDYWRWSAPNANAVYLIGQAQSQREPFRVFDVTNFAQNVKLALYGLDLAAGQHPNDLGRYRELMGTAPEDWEPKHLLDDPNVLRLLNVRYVVWPVAQLGPLEGSEAYPYLNNLRRVSETKLASGQTNEAVYEFPGLARARLVGDARVVDDETAVEVLTGAGFDPDRQVILAEATSLQLPGSAVEGRIGWIERSPNRLTLRVSAESNALLVLSENWFPAWHASVDDREAPVLRADYTLRSVPIEAGEHIVEVWYSSALLRYSLWVSVLCLTLLTAMALWRPRRGRVGDSGKHTGGRT